MIFSQVFREFLEQNTNCNILRHILKGEKNDSYYVNLEKIGCVDVINGTLKILASNRPLLYLDNGLINYANFQEISFGKFCRKILTQGGINELDCDIETAHILFNTHFSTTKLDFIISRDFHKIYDSVKKGINSSVLYQSCMNNKDKDYFKIYELIPECRIIAAYSDKKLVARALLWEIEGNFYVDRIYSLSPYIEKLFIEYTKEMKFIRKYEQSYNLKIYWVDHEDNHFAKNLKIPFDITQLKKTPYIDTFSYFNKKENYLHNGNFDASHTLCSTDGTYESCTFGKIGESDDIEYCKLSKEWGRDFVELSGGTFSGQRALIKNVISISNYLYHKQDPNIVYFLNLKTSVHNAEYVIKQTLNEEKLLCIKRFKVFVKYKDFIDLINYECEHIFSKKVLHDYLNIYPGQAWQSLVETTE